MNSKFTTLYYIVNTIGRKGIGINDIGRIRIRLFANRVIVSVLFSHLLSGVPDYFDRNKILSGYDLSHYQVPHCIRVFFYFV